MRDSEFLEMALADRDEAALRNLARTSKRPMVRLRAAEALGDAALLREIAATALRPTARRLAAKALAALDAPVSPAARDAPAFVKRARAIGLHDEEILSLVSKCLSDPGAELLGHHAPSVAEARPLAGPRAEAPTAQPTPSNGHRPRRTA